jgi:hypothetical protein
VHREQGRHALEPGAVAGRGGHGDHRARHQPADGRRERPFHTGHDDDRVGRTQPFGLGEKPVQAGDPDVVDRHHFQAHGRSHTGRLGGHRSVRGAGGGHGDRETPARRRTPHQQPRPGVVPAAGHVREHGAGGLAVDPGHQHGPGVVGEQDPHDVADLPRLFSRSVNHFWQSLAVFTVHVDACETQVHGRT